ncbi:hypothetical protein Nepgr_010769 [Nepenthes gracilis]|uniref:Uncharacterized protein n=1 Tax=Nepenthes gracilis TaxID=150966 RepID=A0AAD3SE05_NEPGR|nr:hypothetical protein Nepgr_010769 [Nepenthes gracilis]
MNHSGGARSALTRRCQMQVKYCVTDDVVELAHPTILPRESSRPPWLQFPATGLSPHRVPTYNRYRLNVPYFPRYGPQPSPVDTPKLTSASTRAGLSSHLIISPPSTNTHRNPFEAKALSFIFPHIRCLSIECFRRMTYLQIHQGLSVGEGCAFNAVSAALLVIVEDDRSP